MSDKLRNNLISGDSYLTQGYKDPAKTGQIIYDNIMATVDILLSHGVDDDGVTEFVIDNLHTVGEYWTRRYSPKTAAKRIDIIAKQRGGSGWLPTDPAAVSLGSRGGTVSTDAKSAAARANGRKGGRPRKQAAEH